MNRTRNEKERRQMQEKPLVEKLSEEAGDVPGWVLITLMTTGLVVGVWSIAAPALSNLMNDSLSQINVI
jgi:hypothetical protein